MEWILKDKPVGRNLLKDLVALILFTSMEVWPLNSPGVLCTLHLCRAGFRTLKEGTFSWRCFTAMCSAVTCQSSELIQGLCILGRGHRKGWIKNKNIAETLRWMLQTATPSLNSRETCWISSLRNLSWNHHDFMEGKLLKIPRLSSPESEDV